MSELNESKKVEKNQGNDHMKKRNEFLFLYDIKNGNPNGDPDENRPRIDDVNKRCYVTDVRLKRFIRDYLIKTEGEDKILVTKLGSKTVNLTERVKDRLKDTDKKKIEGEELLNTLKNEFIDLRMFGSPLAFKNAPEEWGERSSITGAIQINFGETLHQVEENTFHGTAIFASSEEKGMGTFTTYYGIPYGIIAFHGVANENAAKKTELTDEDYEKFKIALWKGVREALTRTKREQYPRLLINIVYKEEIEIEENGNKIKVPTEYHIGSLEEKVKLTPKEEVIEEINIKKYDDYSLDFSELINSIKIVKDKIKRVEYCLSPEFMKLYEKSLISKLKETFTKNFELIDIDIDHLNKKKA